MGFAWDLTGDLGDLGAFAGVRWEPPWLAGSSTNPLTALRAASLSAKEPRRNTCCPTKISLVSSALRLVQALRSPR